MTNYNSPKFLLRLNSNYALIQAAYWCAFCMMYSFSTVYLTHKGFSDTQIGITVSIIGLLNIALQLSVSSFTDSHGGIPIKKIIGTIYIISILLAALMSFVPMLPAMLMIVFTVAAATQNSINSMINAMIGQYNENGIDATYGWPRGVGSLAYSILAFFGGIIVDKYSPEVLPRLFILFALTMLAAVLLMPDPYKLTGNLRAAGGKKKTSSTSLKDMLLKNPILLVFLFAVLVNSAGQVATNTFLIRIIEKLGGNARTLGTCMLIQAGVEFPVMIMSSFIFRRFKPRYLLLVSFISFTIKMMALAYAPNMGVVYGAMAFSIFCFGLFGVTVVIFINRIVGITEKVRGQAMVSVFGSFGAMLSNAVSGRMIDKIGLHAQLTMSWIACGFAAVLMLVCVLMINKRFGRDY
jgi:PPP family 3-phenylpropionic acid transporter